VSCVCANLRMATRAVARLYDEALEPAGIRTTQFSILARVEADGPATLGRIAARLALDRTTLSRELGPLVERGLVTIVPGRDRRSRVVALTPDGETLLETARPRWRSAQRRVRDGLGLERSKALNAELRAVTTAVLRASYP
jgi:DNA-binding MarR family transcriptional regulator